MKKYFTLKNMLIVGGIATAVYAVVKFKNRPAAVGTTKPMAVKPEMKPTK